MKKNIKNDLACNGGQKKGSPSSKGGFALACVILVMEEALTSLKFITTLESFGDPSNGSRAPPPSPIELMHGTLVRCIFNFVDDVSVLSMIFLKLFTFTSEELSGEDLEGPSSLAFIVGGSGGTMVTKKLYLFLA